jgi:hypothetical protein
MINKNNTCIYYNVGKRFIENLLCVKIHYRVMHYSRNSIGELIPETSFMY